QTLTSGEPSAARTTVGPPVGRSKPMARPAPAAAVPMTKERRLSLTCLFMASSSGAPGRLDRPAPPLEGAAAADIGDGVVDILVGRLRLFLKQRRHGHDHAALAIAALRHVAGNPGLLHLVQLAIRAGQALDGGDLLAGGFADGHTAGAH